MSTTNSLLDEIPDPPAEKQKRIKRNRRRLLVGASVAIATAATGIVAYRQQLGPKHYFPMANHFGCELTGAEGRAKGAVSFKDDVVDIPYRGDVTFPMVKFTEEWSLLFWVQFIIIRQVFDSEEEEVAYRKQFHASYVPFLSANGWGIFFKDGKIVLEGKSVMSKSVAVRSQQWTLCHFRIPPTIGEITLSHSSVSDITMWERVITDRELSEFSSMSRNEYRQGFSVKGRRGRT